MLTSRNSYTRPTFKLRDQAIQMKRFLRYLGVHMDASHTFIEHARSAGMKATKTGNAPAIMLPNIGGPRQLKGN